MKKDSNVKLSIYNDNRIIIENYSNLLDLNDEQIKVDIYTIVGKFLKLRQMDNYIIEVIGTISEIVVEE
jgi:hypothetical protein